MYYTFLLCEEGSIPPFSLSHRKVSLMRVLIVLVPFPVRVVLGFV